MASVDFIHPGKVKSKPFHCGTYRSSVEKVTHLATFSNKEAK